MAIPTEAQVKEQRIWQKLAELGYESLIVTRRDNFAWLTCGGRAVVCYGEPGSPVFLVLTPDHKYAVGYSIDLIRTAEEVLAGLGYEPIPLPSFGKTTAEVALQRAVGRVAADSPLPGATDINATIVSLHEPYTPEEMARYALAAAESGELIRELAYWVEPGMTERQVMAHAWELYVAHGFEGRYFFCGADERIRRYRHPVFTDKPIQYAVLIAPCAAKWGLHVPLTRMVYFDEPPADIRRRFRAVATMQAAMLATIRPGVKLTTLRAIYLELFDSSGYPEEKDVHFHGGPIGYFGSMPERCLDQAEVVKPNMAFAWYFTVAGVKSEELMLVTEQGATLRSVDPSWPLLEVEYEGQRLAVPDILVR